MVTQNLRTHANFPLAFPNLGWYSRVVEEKMPDLIDDTKLRWLFDYPRFEPDPILTLRWRRPHWLSGAKPGCRCYECEGYRSLIAASASA